MKDAELEDLLKDFKGLLKDLEWCDSCDISEEGYFESVNKFKNKWFKKARTERLKQYVDNTFEALKQELYQMIGEGHE